MKEMHDLQADASRSAEARGHQLGVWQALETHTAGSKCVVCGMEVVCDTKPPANGIDICGQAVALNCRTKVS